MITALAVLKAGSSLVQLGLLLLVPEYCLLHVGQSHKRQQDILVWSALVKRLTHHRVTYHSIVPQTLGKEPGGK